MRRTIFRRPGSPTRPTRANRFLIRGCSGFHNTSGVGNNHGSRTPDSSTSAASNAEALLRYNEAGSPALTSDILRNMPNFDFAKPTHQAVRNLLTPYSMSKDVPHLPWCVPLPGKYVYTVAAQGGGCAPPATSPTASSMTWTNANADQMLPGDYDGDQWRARPIQPQSADRQRDHPGPATLRHPSQHHRPPHHRSAQLEVCRRQLHRPDGHIEHTDRPADLPLSRSALRGQHRRLHGPRRHGREFALQPHQQRLQLDRPAERP